MKTSVKISLKFTLFTTIILLVFGIFLQIAYFKLRYTSIQRRFEEIPPMMSDQQVFSGPDQLQTSQMNDDGMMPRRQARRGLRANIPNRTFIYDPEIIGNITSNYFRKNIYIEDSHRFVAEQISTGTMIIFPIDDFISGQKILGQISIFLVILFTGIAYIISKFFVQSSLAKLFELVEFVKSLDSESLENNFKIIGNPNDEINILADSINSTTTTIYNHTKNLKDFVSFASHELRTPIMVINSDLDYIIKSKKYEDLSDIKQNIKKMENLIEKLLQLTKIGKFVWKIENTALQNTLTKIVQNHINLYKDKKITVKTNIENITIKTDLTAISMIFGNLVSNAFKYTDMNGVIKIDLNTNSFAISNTGNLISADEKDKIRQKFWKKDESRTDGENFGIGLSLVSEVCKSLGYRVSLDIDNGQNKFTVSW